MDKRGWIRVYRELLDKPIWKNTTPQQKVIFITILLLANHKDNTWIFNNESYTCEPGQFVTSLENLKNACGDGITIQNIRTALKIFEKIGFLTNQSTKSGRVITVVNWGKYQNLNDELTNDSTKNQQSANKELTKNQQRPNKELTTNKNIKNDKNDKNDKNIYISEIEEIIKFLNEKCGTNYRTNTKGTQKDIVARLKEGFTVEQFKKVIAYKSEKWLNDEKMRDYLRPETLFEASHFESYLNQATAEKPEKYPGLDERMKKRNEEILKDFVDDGRFD